MALGYPDQAHIRGALGDLHALEGDYPRALASLEAAAAGLASLAEGDPEGGLAFGLEALELCEQIGDRHRQAAVHNNLADLLHAMDRDEEANAHMVEAVTLFSSVGEPGELLQPQIWMLADR